MQPSNAELPRFATRPPLERRRVLLVDDEPHVVAALELHLEREFAVTTTSSAKEALLLAREHPFDAVVSDLRMPDIDGVTLLETIKRYSPGTARLLLTGDADIGTAVAAINSASVHRFLTKPCAAEALRDAVRAATAANNGLDGDALLDLGRRATLGVLASSIGHEMGNMMVALEACVSAVRTHIETGQAVAAEDMSILDIVHRRLREHTAQLGTLGKPRELLLEEVDVTHVVTETVGILQRVGTLRMATVLVSLPPESPVVVANTSSLESALVNLLKNASEAIDARAQQEMDEGAFPSPFTIEVRVRVDDARVTIEVVDNGCGIAADRLARLFEPFRTTKGARGTGLGLGIARAVLERQGATLSASSVVGEGSRFVISLPRNRALASGSRARIGH